MDLNTIWFVLVGVLITGYAVLDGFDFGVGILHLFTENEREKRVSLNAIGPVWDGNEVWLLTAGGALFAAFPVVYATVFSGFYIALMLLLLALIMRAVSMEFRSKVDNAKWRKMWDFAFGIGSLLPPVLFGVAIGNILHGLPINEKGIFTGSFLALLNPYSILIGVLSCVMFIMHGAIYLAMKSQNEQHDRSMSVASKAWVAFVILYVISTLASIVVSPFLFEGILKNPLFWILFILMTLSIVFLPLALKLKRLSYAFISSSVVIASMIGLMAVSLFPRLVPSVTDLSYSLTVYNSSSTGRTLSTMLIVALLGMPLVILYTAFIYRVFKGKVTIDEGSC
ncbi:MAG: cytochrome d ubiquinol oxidase subunit II [Ignavibacteria bacterium]|nr:cytochrome d ubiquinol oxidase subunit II [Ignavibacteria bacterium]MCU7502927.1 cytochrome d ubiquinol oxidase subunit II [Ignavibacteria bacterium]MCU7515579.1 cytochrome d ubiquinol oxidase subunit II [Ignavibacteria bacterium]